MNHNVRIGVVGCGNVAMGSYLPYVRQLQAQGMRVELTAACDVDESRRDAVRQRFGVETFSTRYEDVIQSPEIDVVLVLTSMPQHGIITHAALEAGKHVMVEKPMAMTLEEAAQIVELARHSPGYLLCAPHVILSETYQAMWRRVHNGEIGKVLSARGLYGWSGPNWGAWYYQPGGGSLFDLGVYNITPLTGLLGPVRRVMAMSGIAIPERVVNGERVQVRTDDNFQLLLDFGESVFPVVSTGFTMQRYRCAGIELYGSEGTIQLIGEDWDPKGYELWRNDAGCWQVYEAASRWRWTDGLRHFIECVQTNTPPIITPDHAYHVLEIMLKSMESGQDGMAKPIESSFVPPTFGERLKTDAAHLIHDPGRS